MADFLDEKLKEIDDRLNELRPLVEEHARLEAARGALAGVTNGSAASAGSRRRSPGRPRGSGAGSRRGRRRGGSTRAAEALELVRARPGITIRELAEAMSIAPNYLYRILPTLEQDGQVARDGKGWVATGGGHATVSAGAVSNGDGTEESS
jgi:predicted Rossmann fold nucleotide-binding protein DprA/Smf involved in DNA uptake